MFAGNGGKGGSHFRALECEQTHHRDCVNLTKVVEMSGLLLLEGKDD